LTYEGRQRRKLRLNTLAEEREGKCLPKFPAGLKSAPPSPEGEKEREVVLPKAVTLAADDRKKEGKRGSLLVGAAAKKRKKVPVLRATNGKGRFRPSLIEAKGERKNWLPRSSIF